ncbi:hypothetical protein GQ53DRAFT_756066 [Thozetella sp. PMI_491]|nr:hypothetical protein GQ53DRAFT_756066 [Thozetella sp. PMI_491]
MTTFTLKDHNVPVILPEGLTEEQLLAFYPFNSWISTFSRSLALQARNPSHAFHEDPYVLRSITVQAFDRFGPRRLGFVKLTTDVSNSAGDRLPGAVFLRGASVAMLVMLIPEDAPAETDERYVLLTVQPRVAGGSLAFVELPAGMVDDVGNFAGTAAQEIQEELGLEIPSKDLICLSDLAQPAAPSETQEDGDDEQLSHAMFPSPGACDEFIRIYAHERRVPRAQLGEWTGRLTGLREHGEKITLKLVRLQDLWKEGARDAKALSAIALWEGLRREGKL